MNKVKLVFFKGCPNYEQVDKLLRDSGVEYEKICQDDLGADEPDKNYSSPSILVDDDIIYGKRLDPGSSACSAEKFDADAIKNLLNNYSCSTGQEQNSKRSFGAIGSFGSALIVGLCPVCIPAIGALLSSIGLGFLVKEEVLKPALILLLTVALFGFLWSYLKEHRKIGPLVGGVIMAVALYVGRYVYVDFTVNMILMYGGIAGIIGVSIWNIQLKKKYRCSSCKI